MLALHMLAPDMLALDASFYTRENWHEDLTTMPERTLSQNNLVYGLSIVWSVGWLVGWLLSLLSSFLSALSSHPVRPSVRPSEDL